MKQIEISETAYRTLASKHGDVASYVERLAADERPADIQLIPILPETIDIAELIRSQGVEPITDFRSLKGDFYPPEETSDEFLEAIEERRRHDAPSAG